MLRSDEQLALGAQGGDPLDGEELLRRFTGLAYAIAGDFFDTAGDADDLRQEALIGLWEAIHGYRAGLGVTFKTFAALCIRRQLITALKTSRRKKHLLLTWASRVVVNDEGEETATVEQVPDSRDVVETLIARDALAELAVQLRVDLSPMEAHCVILRANGLTYDAIAERLGIAGFKAVDRAITRAQWKLAGQGPPSDPQRHQLQRLPGYWCVECGGLTRRKRRDAQPTVCNVCTLREAA